MIRIFKIFPILLVLLFSNPAFSDVDSQAEPDLEWECDPDAAYDKDGEIEIIVEKLSQAADHKALCIYENRQNSILWRTKRYSTFKVTLALVPANPDAPPNPFYVPSTDLLSVNGRLSSGTVKRSLDDNKEFRYKITIEFLDSNGQVFKTIDPHTVVHTRN